MEDEERERLIDLIQSLFVQGAYNTHDEDYHYYYYDHACISCYKAAQELLLRENRIDEDKCLRK